MWVKFLLVFQRNKQQRYTMNLCRMMYNCVDIPVVVSSLINVADDCLQLMMAECFAS